MRIANLPLSQVSTSITRFHLPTVTELAFKLYDLSINIYILRFLIFVVLSKYLYTPFFNICRFVEWPSIFFERSQYYFVQVELFTKRIVLAQL